MYRPYIKSRRFWVGAALGSAVTIAALALAAGSLVAALPAEMRYRSVTPTPAERTAPASKAPPLMTLAPYVEGFKDGVAFHSPADTPLSTPFFAPFEHPVAPALPHNYVPEPGVLALLALPLAWLWRKS